jgi:iron complex transport system ATP-binding protein
MTVAEYVLLGRTAHLRRGGKEMLHDHEAVASVLDCLDLLGFADRYVTTLSGGEAQRVAIARALAQQTGVLLLDEPTSALDLGHRDAVLRLIDELRRNEHLAVVAAMHDVTSAAIYADRLVLIAGGRVVAAGTPRDVLTDDLLSQAYGAPLRVREVDGVPVVLGATR